MEIVRGICQLFAALLALQALVIALASTVGGRGAGVMGFLACLGTLGAAAIFYGFSVTVFA